MAMLARTSASGETRMPPWMTRSAWSGLVSTFVMGCLSSQHRPAAVDRQVDTRDLARDVARKKQTGVGDVVIDGDAFQRIIGGMSLRGFFFRYAELLRHVAAVFFPETGTVNHARRDAVDVDVVLADFERKTLGDATQPPFGGRIRHASGAAAHAEGAPDIDDLAVVLVDHGRQHRSHGVEAAVHVERDDLVELFRRRLYAGLADRA